MKLLNALPYICLIIAGLVFYSFWLNETSGPPVTLKTAPQTVFIPQPFIIHPATSTPPGMGLYPSSAPIQLQAQPTNCFQFQNGQSLCQ